MQHRYILTKPLTSRELAYLVWVGILIMDVPQEHFSGRPPLCETGECPYGFVFLSFIRVRDLSGHPCYCTSCTTVDIEVWFTAIESQIKSSITSMQLLSPGRGVAPHRNEETWNLFLYLCTLYGHISKVKSYYGILGENPVQLAAEQCWEVRVLASVTNYHKQPMEEVDVVLSVQG